MGSFFDTAERGALTLTLSHNDPFDAEYLTQDGVPLYRVCTRRHSRSTRSSSSGSGTGIRLLDVEIITIQRLRVDPPSTSTSSEDAGCSEKIRTTSPASRRSRAGIHRHGRYSSSPRWKKSTSVLSASTPLDTIDEIVDSSDDPMNGEGGLDGQAERSDSPSTGAEDSERSESQDDSLILVATIERRPLSLSPVRLRFHGSEGAANKFLQRERPFSSTRCFLSMTGDLLKWQLSTPVPKLYNSNKTRIAKYCAPFLPSKGMLSSSTAVLEITQGIDSDRALDEILVTLLLTFIL